MKASFYRYVRHGDVIAYLKCGWIARTALNGTHHGEWSVLMEWLCDCEIRQAKDAEIERLKSGWHDCISDLTAAQKRAEQAERALAEQGSSNSKVAGSNPAECASSSPQKREG